MCVALCSRRRCLFWTHEDCSADFCPVVREQHGPCQSCRHRQDDETCALTRAPLPESGGCCHWNVAPLGEPVRITPAMVAPLAGFFDQAKHLLADIPHRVSGGRWLIPAAYRHRLDEWDVPYQPDKEELSVDPEQMVLVIDEPITSVLERLDTPYRVDSETGVIWVEPGDLGLPQVYGRGVSE